MNSLGIQLRISDMLFAVQKRWKIILLLTLLGGVFGALLSGLSYVQKSEDSYQIRGSFILVATNSNDRYSSNSSSPNRNDFILAGDLYDMFSYLVKSERLLSTVIRDTRMSDRTDTATLKSAISLSRHNDTTIVTMTLTWENAEQGLQLWENILSSTNALLAEIVNVGRLRVINPPTTRMVSSRGGGGSKTGMLLPILGLVAGISFSIVEMLMHPTLINVKDVETVFALETLGTIPYDPAHFSTRESLLVAQDATSSEVLQNYASAAFILRNRLGAATGHCQCLYLTSTGRREGRTSAAANLAIQLSDMERKTLLIDFDFKHPSLGQLFLSNMDYQHSLNALYQGEIGPEEAITPMTGHLDILPLVMEHNQIIVDNSLLDLITHLKDSYEYILIDAPPVGTDSEVLRLNPVTSSVVFVARYDKATIPEIQAALDKLEKSGIQIAGVIVNGVMSSRSLLLDGSQEGTPASKKKTGRKKKKRRPGSKQRPDARAKAGGKGRTDKKDNKDKTGQKAAAGEGAPGADEGASPEKSAPAGDASAAAAAEKAGKKARRGKRKPGAPAAPKTPPISAASLFDSLEAPAGNGEDRLMSGLHGGDTGSLLDSLMDLSTEPPATRSDEEITSSLVDLGLKGKWDSEHAGEPSPPAQKPSERN